MIKAGVWSTKPKAMAWPSTSEVTLRNQGHLGQHCHKSKPAFLVMWWSTQGLPSWAGRTLTMSVALAKCPINGTSSNYAQGPQTEDCFRPLHRIAPSPFHPTWPLHIPYSRLQQFLIATVPPSNFFDINFPQIIQMAVTIPLLNRTLYKQFMFSHNPLFFSQW